MLSDSENMDVLLSSENRNPIERELANVINSSTSNKDTEAFSNKEEILRKRMKLRILVMKTQFLGKVDYLRLWKGSQMRLICV